jgi:hypothetical protein
MSLAVTNRFLEHVNVFSVTQVRIFFSGGTINLSHITSKIHTVTIVDPNSTELSPSHKAASCAATQELPSILRNLKVRYRVHKSPSLVPVLSQINSVHITPSYLSKIRLNIIHPLTSWSS